MSANLKAVAHYREMEGSAKEAARAREVIHELRLALHETIGQLNVIADALTREKCEWVELVDRAQKTLHDTLPGAELDALDAMTKPERRETLRDAMFDIAMSAAKREAIHTGPFNWSGKELRDPGDYEDPENIFMDAPEEIP